jgi:hypothetical protein
LLATGAYVSGGVVCLAYVRLVHPVVSNLSDPRLSTVRIGHSLAEIMKAQRVLWVESFTLMAPYAFLGVCVLACAAFLLIRSAELKANAKLGVLCAAVLLILASFAPHVVTAVVWIVPRSMTTLMALPGVFLLAALWFGEQEPAPRLAVGVLAAAWLVLTISFSNRVLADYLSGYRQDQQEALVLYERLVAYERQTGRRIAKLAFSFDQHPTWCRAGARCYGDLNVRAWTKPWARTSLLRFVTGREFTEAPFAPHTVKEIFGTENWNGLSPDQIRFDNDTAYIAVY